jgi:hypothetical protein
MTRRIELKRSDSAVAPRLSHASIQPWVKTHGYLRWSLCDRADLVNELRRQAVHVIRLGEDTCPRLNARSIPRAGAEIDAHIFGMRYFLFPGKVIRERWRGRRRSRSDLSMLAVGFNPRFTSERVMRRGATPEVPPQATDTIGQLAFGNIQSGGGPQHSKTWRNSWHSNTRDSTLGCAR